MSPFKNAELYKQFTDALPFGAYVVDLERRILYWNHAAERISGYLAQEVMGRSCRDDLLVHCRTDGPAVCTSDGCPLLACLRSGKPADANLFLQHKEGHRIPVRIQAIPLRDEGGTIIAVAELFQDDSGDLKDLWDPGSGLDPVLGIPTALATQEQLRVYLAQLPPRLAVFVVAIEQLHEMEEKQGKELVHSVLLAVVQTLSGCSWFRTTLAAGPTIVSLYWCPIAIRQLSRIC